VKSKTSEVKLFKPHFRLMFNGSRNVDQNYQKLNGAWHQKSHQGSNADLPTKQ